MSRTTRPFRHSLRVLAAFAAGCLVGPLVFAADGPPQAGNANAAEVANAADPLLVRRGSVEIHKSDYVATLAKLPPEKRAEYASSSRRNRDLVERLLVTRELAALAVKQKLDGDPQVRQRMQKDGEAALADAWITDVGSRAAREFDARRTTFEKVAREQYMVDKASYSTPETIAITAMFFSAQNGGSDAAKARADAAYEKIKAGADVEQLAATISEDPDGAARRGKAGPFTREVFMNPGVRAAFELAKPGDITAPVRAKDGWYIARLDERRLPVEKPFAEVEPAIMEALKKQYVQTETAAAVKQATSNPDVFVDDAAIEALRQENPYQSLPPPSDPAKSVRVPDEPAK